MKLFAVGKVSENPKEWEFMGIFDDQQLAEKQCFDESYFVGPCELNKNTGEPTLSWPDSYYPKKIREEVIDQAIDQAEENVSLARKDVFREELEHLINRHSMENGSDTPDFILAEFLNDCLAAWDKNVTRREEWYDRGKKPVQVGYDLIDGKHVLIGGGEVKEFIKDMKE